MKPAKPKRPLLTPDQRLRRHVMLDLRHPEAKQLRSALLGGVCWRCWKTRWEIMEAVDGEKCERDNTKWAKPPKQVQRDAS